MTTKYKKVTANSGKLSIRLLLRNFPMIEILLAVGLGIGLGVLAGLVPGLHPNNTIPMILSLAFFLGPLYGAVVLICAGVVNSFVSFIPSILLGAPEDSEALGVLPGHRLLLDGRGFEAVKLTVVGSLGGMSFSILTLPLLVFLIPPVFTFIRPMTHWLLIGVVCFMTLTENGIKNKLFAIGLVLLSGILGLVVLDISDLMIFPLLSGLFGLPLLFISIFKKTKLPTEFSFEEERIGKKKFFSSISRGSLAGIITGLLPGIGSAQATIMAQQVTRSKGEGRDFLVSIGAVTTANVIYSLLALWLIGHPRSGIAVAVGELLKVNLDYILIFLSVIVISSGVATYTTLKLCRHMLSLIKKINYRKMCAIVFISINTLILIFSGHIGLLVGIVSLSVGLIPNLIDVRRSHCMGCLVIPTILWFSGLV